MLPHQSHLASLLTLAWTVDTKRRDQILQKYRLRRLMRPGRNSPMQNRFPQLSSLAIKIKLVMWIVEHPFRNFRVQLPSPVQIFSDMVLIILLLTSPQAT
uniref:Uncharacterized protein n=1 Tax=Opuntia streptacantha TaxID=393608 RepID=A0A7C8YX78_OPUST